MSCFVRRSPHPSVAIFSSIQEVSESLTTTAITSNISFTIIKDDALSGYGGTVKFSPESLSANTLQSLAEAEILISEPAVVASIINHYGEHCFRNLKWCQSTYVGVDPLFDSNNHKPTAKRNWILTRFAGIFGDPIAEWVLARIIEHERSFVASHIDQQNKEWAGSRNEVTQYRYLSSLTISVLGGCGDIGKCIIKAASFGFKMKTVAYGKTDRKKSNNNDNDMLPDGLDVYTQDLQEALQMGDYIVSVLPSTPDTKGLLNDETLSIASKINGGKSPVFLNVGRGDVITEQSIISSLDRGYISAAILDVFGIEPLPRSSPLWNKSNVIISPHVSGITQASDVPKIFFDNYERYIAGKDLKYVVDWDKGY
ncbi:NAD(P)-binding protein [Fragilariopsis cylindrus CCMP1102]|uniref:NAD(P)-binding protein n=1 Tax=Fragilariopsis cylindrus CCMP1102 TaxID=635003 RepID=A0A1E7FQ06_9STRA|nr:NAD(P)-binding protein [Fragilariopsis cylindrus CCMP1102]|eukprot:OEU20242.1 NAD(P)-binding protein [Fragilariopsis cylindrus CCMP1102]